jgi:hypothetical protein
VVGIRLGVALGLRRPLGGSIRRGLAGRALVGRALVGRALAGRALVDRVFAGDGFLSGDLLGPVLVSGAALGGLRVGQLPTGRLLARRLLARRLLAGRVCVRAVRIGRARGCGIVGAVLTAVLDIDGLVRPLGVGPEVCVALGALVGVGVALGVLVDGLVRPLGVGVGVAVGVGVVVGVGVGVFGAGVGQQVGEDLRLGQPIERAIEHAEVLGRPRGEVPVEQVLFRVVPRRTTRAVK